MSVPDHRSVVVDLFARGGHSLTTKEGAGRFTEAAASALHAVDPMWGHLRKPEGRTHVVDPDGNRHAVDVVLYRASGQIVDIISGAGDPGARLAWGSGPEHEYGEGDWYAPAAVAPPVPDLEPVAPILEPIIAPVASSLQVMERELKNITTNFSAMEEAMVLLVQEVRERLSLFPDYRAEGKISGPWPIGNAPFSVTLKPVPKE